MCKKENEPDDFMKEDKVRSFKTGRRKNKGGGMNEAGSGWRDL